MESLNNYPNWLEIIIIEIDKFLIYRKYINFFMQMQMQWSKEYGSTSSSQTLSLPRLYRFEKLDLSQFQFYIESETMTQCFFCHNCKTNIIIQAAAGKERVFCILHMLIIHTDLRKWSKTHIFDLHLNKMNQFGIHEP